MWSQFAESGEKTEEYEIEIQGHLKGNSHSDTIAGKAGRIGLPGVKQSDPSAGEKQPAQGSSHAGRQQDCEDCKEGNGEVQERRNGHWKRKKEVASEHDGEQYENDANTGRDFIAGVFEPLRSNVLVDGADDFFFPFLRQVKYEKGPPVVANLIFPSAGVLQSQFGYPTPLDEFCLPGLCDHPGSGCGKPSGVSGECGEHGEGVHDCGSLAPHGLGDSLVVDGDFHRDRATEKDEPDKVEEKSEAQPEKDNEAEDSRNGMIVFFRDGHAEKQQGDETDGDRGNGPEADQDGTISKSRTVADPGVGRILRAA